jgi:hypothetical protein
VKGLTALAVIAVLSLAGCAGQTDPATNTTATSATLHNHVSCNQGEGGKVWWRTKATGGAWVDTAHVPFTCPEGGATDLPLQYQLNGLTPSTHYQFEYCSDLGGETAGFCVNADGQAAAIQIGGPPEPIDSFDTLAPSGPPFLNGLTRVWSDDASAWPPVEAGKWDYYACQRQDGQQAGSRLYSQIQPSRLQQIGSGGPDGSAYEHFYAPQGDNIWTPGTAGRCELSYPQGDNSAGFTYRGPGASGGEPRS